MANESLKAMPCDTDLTGQDLGGMTLTPGVYCFSSSAGLTGALVLSGAGPWVFKIGSTLTTASASSVLVPGGGTCSGANVFWQVGSSATLGTGSGFAGNIVATASVTATTGVSVSGSLLAINGAVTMDSNLVSACGARVVPPDDDDDDDCKKHDGKCKCQCKCRHHDGGHGGHDRDHDRDCNDRDHDDHDGRDRDRDHKDKDRGHDKDRDHDKDRKDHDNKDRNDRDKDRNDKGRDQGRR